jgi:hypothetical protein
MRAGVSSALRLRSLFPLLWATFAIQALTDCSGRTEERAGQSGTSGSGGRGGQSSGAQGGAPGGSGDTSASGYSGYAGHTAGCLQPNHTCGGPCGPCGGNGGISGGGNGGISGGGNAGSSGSGGFSGYVGFGGHTSGCIGQCGGACPPCPPNGGTSSDAGGMGGAGAGGQADGGAPAAKRAAPRRISQACYPLAGYEPDACLPPDDSLLPWLSPLPSACAPTVTAGPELAGLPDGRACCYSVACGESAE